MIVFSTDVYFLSGVGVYPRPDDGPDGFKNPWGVDDEEMSKPFWIVGLIDVDCVFEEFGALTMH